MSGVASTSLERAPGPSTSFVRGKSGHVPFWPGGLDDVLLSSDAVDVGDIKKGLRTVPPGLSRGLRLPGDDTEETGLLELDESTDRRRELHEEADDEVHGCSVVPVRYA